MSSAFEGLPKTPNLKLNKPGYDNVADIEALNENADILDAEIQGIKNTFVKSVNGINAGDDGNVDLGIIPISQGGTGATTVAGARNALGLGNTTGALPIANGGTGATTASDACKNLGAVQTVNGKEPDAGGNVNVANMTGASDSAAGKAGLVPAPAAGMQNKFLCSDATWKDAGGLPVGHEFFTTNPNIPAGCIPLLGGAYSRTAYADLWAWVQTQAGYLLEESAWQAKATANGGNVPFYSKGDGSTTFRVPALKCWVKGASNISEVGGYLVAGLPNIDTNVYIGQDGTGYPNGSADSTNVGSTASYPRKTKLFRASDYNTIYGSSDTVQPPSIVGLWCVKAYGTITNVGSTDVANISTGLTQAETRISALENHDVGATVVETYRKGTKWYRVWSDGWIEQGGLVWVGNEQGSITVTFSKPFNDTNYTLTTGSRCKDAETIAGVVGMLAKTLNTTQCVITKNGWTSNYNGCYVHWIAEGQGA